MTSKVIVFISMTVLLFGCSNEKSNPTEAEAATPSRLSTFPADGASGIRLDEPIVFQFAESVDRANFEDGFRLISDSSLTDSLCPKRASMRHGMITNIMSDSMSLIHAINVHTLNGRFDWNETSTICRYQVSGLLQPKAQFMVLLMPSAVSILRQKKLIDSTTSIIRRNAIGEMLSFHFTTLDTTKSGHSSHH